LLAAAPGGNSILFASKEANMHIESGHRHQKGEAKASPFWDDGGKTTVSSLAEKFTFPII